MNVAFFIGHHKTGSTALQTYLASQYLTLLQAGILYPAVESKGLAHNLNTVLKGSIPAQFSDLNIREPHNALAFGLMAEGLESDVPNWHKNLPSSFQMLQAIDEQMNALAPRHTILCSEVMSRFSEQGWPKIMPRIQARFAKHDCTIVLNLRRIDAYIASWHLQQLKFGFANTPLRAGAQSRYFNTAHFQYDQIVSRWTSTLPSARMIVRNYTDVLTAGGSVVDFFAQSKIDHIPIEPLIRHNPSVPYAMAEIMRLANLTIPKHFAAMLAYILAASQRVDFPPDSEVELFGEQNRRALLEAFRPIHQNLSQSTGLAEFFPDLAEVAVCRPLPELAAAARALQALRHDAVENAPNAVVRDFLLGLVLGS